jgi:hypothetical protein
VASFERIQRSLVEAFSYVGPKTAGSERAMWRGEGILVLNDAIALETAVTRIAQQEQTIS